MDNARKEIYDLVMSDAEIRKFIKDNHIKDELVNNNLSLFFEQKQNNDTCRSCMGKKPCLMDTQLMQTKLEYKNGRLNQMLVNCPHVDRINEELLQLMFFPKEYTDGDLYSDRISRKEVYSKVSKFTKDPLKNKGLYIHGAFGTGKTFILLKTAQQLTKQGLSVIFAYYPDLVRHIKSSISNNGVETIVNELKDVDVLMLDDIGGENNTSFIRDEVLGPVLQYRMLGNKPTCMTSNASIEMLRNHFMETKDEVDRLKADRIIERIVYMTEVIELKDSNLRRS